MTEYNKMFGFIENSFFYRAKIFIDFNERNLLSCISMNNQECKVRPHIVNAKGDAPVFFPYSVKTSELSGSCNNINNPSAKWCVSEVVKNL